MIASARDVFVGPPLEGACPSLKSLATRSRASLFKSMIGMIFRVLRFCVVEIDAMEWLNPDVRRDPDPSFPQRTDRVGGGKESGVPGAPRDCASHARPITGQLRPQTARDVDLGHSSHVRQDAEPRSPVVMSSHDRAA